MSATVKELLQSDSICPTYAQMKKGPVFVTHRVYISVFVFILILYLPYLSKN